MLLISTNPAVMLYIQKKIYLLSADDSCLWLLCSEMLIMFNSHPSHG